MKLTRTLMIAAAAMTLTASAALAEGDTVSGNEATGSADQSYNSDQNNSTSGGAGPNEMSGASGAGAMISDRDTVHQAQTSLNNEGYNVSMDGIWGPQTASAIRQFQQANGLNATGTLNSETLAALDVDTGM